MKNLSLQSTILIKSFDLELKKILAADLAKYRNKQFIKAIIKQAA